MGHQIIYFSANENKPGLWRLSLEGGSPLRLTDYYASSGTASPTDGRMAITFLDQSVTPPRIRIGLIPPEGGLPKEKFDLPSFSGTLAGGFYNQVVRWTADGKGLTYIQTKDGISNIWVQAVGRWSSTATDKL